MLRFSLLLLLTAAVALPQAPTPEADASFAAKDWTAAEAGYRRAVAANGSDGRAWFRLGGTLHWQDRHLDSRAAFERALAAGFQTPYAMALIGREYGEEKDGVHEREWLEKSAAAGFAQVAVLDNDVALAKHKSESWFAGIRAQVDLNSKPCMANPAFRQFDFWIGEWDVESGGGKVAHSSILSLADGCVIQENWMPLAGPQGKSWNVFNRATGKWEQTWMSAGTVARLEGEIRDGAMRFTGIPAPNTAAATKTRMSFAPLPDGSIHQLWEQSLNDGVSWSPMFDGIYRRAK